MKPYWLLARDNLLRSAVLDSPEAVETWIDSAEPSFTIALMQESAELASASDLQCSDAEELIEAVIKLASPDSPHRESFYAIYAHGGCDVFAVAMQRIIGGDLYAVTDPIDERGKRVRIPNLVHAGVYDGDDVIDIEGRTPVDDWSQRWRENGSCTMEGSTGSVEAKELEKFQSTTHTPAEIYTASKIAWLIAALTGALDDDKLAEYRIMQT